MVSYGYHYTSNSNAKSIRKDGFDISKSGKGAGDVFGSGVYILPEDAPKSTSEFYKKEIGGEPLSLKLNLKKTKTLELSGIKLGFAVRSDGRTIDQFQGLPVDQVKAAVLDGIPDARRKLELALKDPSLVGKFGVVDADKAIRKVLLSEGFDSLKIINEPFDIGIGGTQIVAFDPKRIEVIDSIPRDKEAAKKSQVKERTSNDELMDAQIRHQTYLLRYSANIQARINNILNATEIDIARRIRDRLANNAGLNTPVEWQRLQSLINGIDKVRSGAWEDAIKYLQTQSVGLAQAEPHFMQTIVTEVAPVVVNTAMPSPRLLKAIVTDRPFQGKVLKDWAATLQAEDLRRIHNAIQMGMVAGEDSATIARRVVGTGALNGADGVTQLTRRQVTAITRTAVMHIADSARDAFLKENADIIEMEMFVATLDSRTTPICRSLDGKKFELGKGPRPPLHFQCRSLRVAAMNGELIGNRPAKAATEKGLLREFSKENGLAEITSRDSLPRGMKGAYDEFARNRIRELTGQVPSSTTYQTWLERQSVQFQNDLLGVKKAKLFRDGELKLDQFVAPNGSELTLNQLATKYPGAFEKAGLDASVY